MEFVIQIIRSDMRSFMIAIAILVAVNLSGVLMYIIVKMVSNAPWRKYIMVLLLFFNLLYVAIFFVSTMSRYKERIIPAQEMPEMGTDDAIRKKRSQYGGK